MAQKTNILVDNKPYLYWKIQLISWSLASLYWAYKVYFKDDFSAFHTVVNFIFDVAIGISLTHMYKLVIKETGKKSLDLRSAVILIFSILILSVLFMLFVNLKWYFYWHVVKGESPDFFQALFFWDPPLIAGIRLMSIWVLAYHLYHYIQEQITLTTRNAELSVLAKQVQLDHLSNQLNPHFLFNSLNSVKSLISENTAKARRSIDLLSDLLRASIYSRESFTTLEMELQLINDYIELEKLRFEDRLKIRIKVDVDLLDRKIPILSVQTLVENAIKHGIQNSLKGGEIILSITKASDKIEISVQNPGHLILDKEGGAEGMGLKNLRERLFLLYREGATFNIIEEPNGTVTATILIPLNIDPQ